jgi:SAM-dependent methyltransferase
MKPTCICCSSDKIDCAGKIPSVVSFAGSLLDNPLTGGELFRCRDCGIAFRYPHLKKSMLDELYRQGNSDNWQTAVGERLDWKIAGNWISEHLSPRSAIIDVGCFNGGFLNTVEITGRRFGIEIHEDASNRARQQGIQIIGRDFEALSKTSETFDAVTAFDVIEHTQNPLEFLTQMAGVTNNNGNIIISSGNSEALSWRLLGSRYWYCTLGEHMSFICPTWCKWAGNKLGLEVKKIVSFSHVNSTWKQRVMDFTKNMFYMTAPGGFAVFRKWGMGGNEFRAHNELLCHPPSWMTAKDHILCIFVKKYR